MPGLQLDVDAVLTDIVGAIRQAADNKWEQMGSFARQQSQLLTTQAAMIVQARTIGSLKNDDALYQFFLEGLERDARNFARALVQLTLLTLQEVWNAVVEVLWGHINAVLGQWQIGPLPVPAAPNA